MIAILKVKKFIVFHSPTEAALVSGRKPTGDSPYVQIPQVCQALLEEYRQRAILLGQYSISDVQGLLSTLYAIGGVSHRMDYH